MLIRFTILQLTESDIAGLIAYISAKRIKKFLIFDYLKQF